MGNGRAPVHIAHSTPPPPPRMCVCTLRASDHCVLIKITIFSHANTAQRDRAQHTGTRTKYYAYPQDYDNTDDTNQRPQHRHDRRVTKTGTDTSETPRLRRHGTVYCRLPRHRQTKHLFTPPATADYTFCGDTHHARNH